ncbi:MAG: hypothetical protein E7415_01455 [Ruminococcaceae bacterium]|nr:hypothetical protein [Oscillospiraceae bacterium]
MRRYNSIINDKGVEIQIYAERVREVVGDIEEYFSQDAKTAEDAQLLWFTREGMITRLDIIFDYVNRIEQLGKIAECLSGKLLENDRRRQGQCQVRPNK